MTFFQSHVTLQRWRHQSLRKIPKFHPILLVWKLCGKAQSPHSFGRIVRNYAETVHYRKISTPDN